MQQNSEFRLGVKISNSADFFAMIYENFSFYKERKKLKPYQESCWISIHYIETVYGIKKLRWHLFTSANFTISRVVITKFGCILVVQCISSSCSQFIFHHHYGHSRVLWKNFLQQWRVFIHKWNSSMTISSWRFDEWLGHNFVALDHQ